MGVLHVEYGVFAGLLDNLVQVEFHLRIGFARQHGKAHRITPHFFDQIAERHVSPGALGHAHGLTRLHHMHNLAQHHFQGHAPIRQRLHRGAHARNIAAMIRTPDINQQIIAARELMRMAGDVIGEIGVGAIRFLERPIHIIAKLCGAEQQLRARFPIIRCLALGRFQHTFIKQALAFKRCNRGIGRIRVHQRAFG